MLRSADEADSTAAAEDRDEGPRFRTYTAAELDDAEFPVEFFIENMLVKGQPCGLGGFEKTLKTTLMIAMGMSLALVVPFLGYFNVPERKRTLMFTGESGMATVQETARRICLSHGYDLRDVDGFVVSPDLPEVGNALDMIDFEGVIEQHRPDVVGVDPMYLCMGDVDEKASNMFSMAKPLRRTQQSMPEVRRDPDLCIASADCRYGAAPKLSQFAFSGFKQFLRQWILLNRMEDYKPGTGSHRLKLVSGGNVGHGGLWIANIEEGTRNDFRGRIAGK